MIGSHRPRPLAHRRRAIWLAAAGNSLPVSPAATSRRCQDSTRWYYNMNSSEGNSPPLRHDLVMRCRWFAAGRVRYRDKMAACAGAPCPYWQNGVLGRPRHATQLMSTGPSNAGLKLAPLRMNGPSCGAVGKIPHGGRDRGTAISNSQLVPINTGAWRRPLPAPARPWSKRTVRIGR